MAQTNPKGGQIVKIFTDPVTGQNLEGHARLIEEFRPDHGDGLSIWNVRFERVGDDELYLRTINADCNESS